MRNWETTIFGILAGLGMALHGIAGIPAWVSIVLSSIGTSGLGYAAASTRGVTKELEQRTKDNETTFVKRSEVKP